MCAHCVIKAPSQVREHSVSMAANHSEGGRVCLLVKTSPPLSLCFYNSHNKQFHLNFITESQLHTKSLVWLCSLFCVKPDQMAAGQCVLGGLEVWCKTGTFGALGRHADARGPLAHLACQHEESSSFQKREDYWNMSAMLDKEIKRTSLNHLAWFFKLNMYFICDPKGNSRWSAFSLGDVVPSGTFFLFFLLSDL